MIKVILNEQHSLLQQQTLLLDNKFGKDNWTLLSVPAKGWTKREIEVVEKDIFNDTVVFASPVPLLVAYMNAERGHVFGCGGSAPRLYIFFNSIREKLELPNGKIVYRTPSEGWELIETI